MNGSGRIIPFSTGGARANQAVAPYEARQITRAEQRRVRAAAWAGPILAKRRSAVNQVDYSLIERIRDLEAVEAEIVDQRLKGFIPPMGSALYLVLVGAMLLLEVPVNKAALDFLRLPASESYLLALFFGLVTVAAAKCTARVLRQQAFGDEGRRAWAVALIANSALLTTIFFVAKLRSLEAGHGDSAMTFFGLQFVFYVAALFLSFQRIDPSIEAEQANKRRDGLVHDVSLLWKRRAWLARTHNWVLEKARLRILELEADAEERVAEYRDSNMRARTDPPPTYFRTSIDSRLFRPLGLGHPLDEHPATIRELIAQVRKGGDR